MGGNYEKGIYNQLIEVMEKLNDMESERRQARKDISSLTSEVKSLRKENAVLREEVSRLKQKTYPKKPGPSQATKGAVFQRPMCPMVKLSRQSQHFYIVRVLPQITESVLSSTPFQGTASPFQPGAYMDSAGNSHNPVQLCVRPSNRNC